MFGWGKTANSRRQRAKQLRVESRASMRRLISDRVGRWNIGVAVCFYVLAVIIATMGEPALPYTEGQRIDHAINARVAFSVPDTEGTRDAIIEAKEKTPDYYRTNGPLIDRIVSELRNLFVVGQAESFEQFQANLADLPIKPTNELFAYLRDADENARTSFDQTVTELRDALTRENVVQLNAAGSRDPASTADHIIVQVQAPPSDPSDEPPPPRIKQVRRVDLVTVGSSHVSDRAELLALRFNSAIRPAVSAIISSMLSKEPLLVYDQAATTSAMEMAEKNVEPRFKQFEKGKPLILASARGESDSPVKLTAAQIELLRKEDAAFHEFLRSSSPEAIMQVRARRLERVGTATILLMLTAALCYYVGSYHRRILEVRMRSVSFAALILMVLVCARLIDTRLTNPQLIAAPVVLACAILTIAYPKRFATGVMFMLVLMVALIIKADMAVAVTLLAAGFLICLMLNEIRTRTTILKAGLCSAVLVFLTSLAFELMDRRELSVALRPALLVSGATFVAVLLIQACLPLIERAFSVATALTLLEWRDANRPLLQRLAREAPGTYNHSLVLGTMAEAACDAIGGNGLLAHVGALYHDIGKIPKPEYFAENQEASINRHDKLAPSMSLLIILGHVKDGLEMAKEFGLPRVLIPFIAEHHGTTVVRYFHHIASEKQSQTAKGKHDREVPESGFRYPGPKPRSKETAILMLCDGVEGAVRALNEPTAGRIESVVNQVLGARLKDGQFDDCDITLRELHLVEQSLAKSLCRFYHGRVAYPKEKEASKTDKTSTRTDVAVKSAG